MIGKCSFCGKDIEIIDGRVGRRDTCQFCSRDLHCCKQCRFYEEESYNQCKEPQAERVLDKDVSNFCGYFEFGVSILKNNQKDDVLSKLGSLFKK
ncbi:MAG: hypothetical protein COS89_09195 [Deltaproteobacteria bacterium CG07_land_8_20_14_0_80_38_7]|nr:MAG: hypothetical protein COS89_09195 [Deltaproteobacteria bacterium CG07_land_8_20_14_0_80_38_7]